MFLLDYKYMCYILLKFEMKNRKIYLDFADFIDLSHTFFCYIAGCILLTSAFHAELWKTSYLLS